jgi:hypothetical protein
MKTMDISIKLARFLDADGKLKQWPAKHAIREEACAYIARQFQDDRDYTEQEVNAILASAHTFGDYFLIRRTMVDSGYLCRTPDGSRYWMNKEKQRSEGE